MRRRDFLAALPLSVGALGAATSAHAESSQQTIITLMHTNDTHSRIDPFSRGKYAGMGGVARRSTLIQAIRKQRPHSLLVDSGDIFQGTPYFNLFKGALEMKIMSRLGYDLATLGNHDFDLGSSWLLKVIQQHATFPFVTSNLKFTHAGAEKLIFPHWIREIGGKRLGFFGLGVRFHGLVAADLHKGVTYQSPIPIARQMADWLRKQKKCDAVILLSHLGYNGFDKEPGDLDLAAEVDGIDVILGGHTHTFLHKPSLVKTPNRQLTRIYQVGHSGIYLGQIDLVFEKQGGLQVKEKIHHIKHP